MHCTLRPKQVATAACLLTSNRECEDKLAAPSFTAAIEIVANPAAQPAIKTSGGNIEVLLPQDGVMKVGGNDVLALLEELQSKIMVLERDGERQRQESAKFDVLLAERDRRIGVLEDLVDTIGL
jgi:hypothetical protein